LIPTAANAATSVAAPLVIRSRTLVCNWSIAHLHNAITEKVSRYTLSDATRYAARWAGMLRSRRDTGDLMALPVERKHTDD